MWFYISVKNKKRLSLLKNLKHNSSDNDCERKDFTISYVCALFLSLLTLFGVVKMF